MKRFTALTAIIAMASAGQIFFNQPAENYANPSEIYQSQLEHQQHGLYSGQPQAYVSDQYHSRPSAEKTARILKYISENDGHSYQYSYETENGIKSQEAGQDQGKGITAHGAFSYTGDDGREYTVSYTADEHGFRPQGPHLPTPPPVPEAIVKALEQNARDEAAGAYNDGHYDEPKYLTPDHKHTGHHAMQAIAQSSSMYQHKRSS